MLRLVTPRRRVGKGRRRDALRQPGAGQAETASAFTFPGFGV
ncbi:hypothetical protein [Acidomonas methanolica]|uniref:Uncharacterized protein n=1 Tax=Acidomonas methanolica NBRC 104435 TaxID=1231351 RepID=A0A023D877_ACIMT|nr:hypothetical protein [Acidomonas methanolica]GAJ29945.1 hypothetical protein Amme_085_073 [Acidomonas methanolica NBRC 104435]GEK98276.1 hypothetical protein AME01nite_07750 [Acidomonas methanolica NBRC 104435]